MNSEFKAYIIGDREYFIWDAKPHNPPKRRPAKKEKDFAFAQSLLDFLDVDLIAAGLLFEQTWKEIRALYQHHEESAEIAPLLVQFGEIAQLHIYFEFLNLDWQERLQRYAAGLCENVRDELNYKNISHMYAAAVDWQQQIRRIFERVLSVSSPKGSVQQKLANLYDRTDLRELDLFQFEPIPVKLERVNDSTFIDVLHPNSVGDLVDYFLSEIIRREITFKTCRCCGKFFPSYVHGNAEYCERVFQDNKTCKEIGAVSMFRARLEEYPAMQMYQRAYKTRFARIKAKRMTKEEFTVWGEQARAYRDKVMIGKMGLEEFEKWLKEN